MLWQVADLHEHLKEAAMQQRVRCMRDELVGLYRNSVLAEHASHELPADADEVELIAPLWGVASTNLLCMHLISS